MTLKTSPTELKTVNKKGFSIEEIVKSLRSVGDDVEQIVKLSSEEKRLVAEFLDVLKNVPQQMFSITVSTSDLPFRAGAVQQAHIDQNGNLILTTKDGRMEVLDLTETRNRDIMTAVFGDIVPKFKDFASQLATEKPQKPEPIKEIPAPEPLPAIKVQEEAPVTLEDSDAPLVQDDLPAVLPDSDVDVGQETVPVYSAEDKAKTEEITAQTLNDLETLGNEVFNQSPVSVYFDDWLVHLRQVILWFESSDAITVDEIFTDECEQIFRDIEEELANRLLKEAEIEASAKTLTEKRHILGEMDDEYATRNRYIEVRGKSAIDFLIKNVQRLEEELAKIQQIKTLNPIKRIAKQQKWYTVTQKLRAAKKRLALAMQNSAVQPQVDNSYAACPVKTQDIEIKETGVMDALIREVKELEEELVKIHQTKTLNPIKKIAKEQKVSEVTEKLDAAKQRLVLAAQASEVEQKRIRDEYEKKKETARKKVESLEKEIKRKKTDGSLEARKAATKALSDVVKAFIQRKDAPPQ